MAMLDHSRAQGGVVIALQLRLIDPAQAVVERGWQLELAAVRVIQHGEQSRPLGWNLHPGVGEAPPGDGTVG